MIISREDTIVFEQEDSGKTTSYTVSQSGSSSQDNKLTITSVTYEDAYLFLPGITPVVGSEVYLKVMLPNTFTWKTSSGLTMNRGTAYAGDICNIYVFENSRYKLVKSFKLQTGTEYVQVTKFDVIHNLQYTDCKGNVRVATESTSTIMETSATSETITTLVPTVTKVIDVIIPNGVSIINQQILDELPTSLPVKGHCAYSVFDVRITPTPAPSN